MPALRTIQNPAVIPHFRAESALSFLGNVALPGSVFLALNAAAVQFGLPAPASTFSDGMGLPGNFVALGWVFALVSWGFVRFCLRERGYAGREAADWMAMLLAAAVAFPFMTLGFDFFWTSAAAFGLALLALGALIRVAKVSSLLAGFMLPAIAAVLLPAVVGFSILAMGWTPPFGATQAAEGAAPRPEV
jgi:hypothetical protein